MQINLTKELGRKITKLPYDAIDQVYDGIHKLEKADKLNENVYDLELSYLCYVSAICEKFYLKGNYKIDSLKRLTIEYDNSANQYKELARCAPKSSIYAYTIYHQIYTILSSIANICLQKSINKGETENEQH